MNKSALNSKTRNFAGCQFLIVILFLLIAVRPAVAASVALAWTPSPNPAVTGFIVYYGTASRAYTQSLTVGNVTNVTVNGLASGATYYFAATTYDAAGNQSTFSQEVSYFIPVPVETNTVPTPPVTNTVPVIVTNEPPIVTTVPPTITNTPPVIEPPATNTPPVVTNTPPVVIPPVITNVPPVVSDPSALPTLDSIGDISLRPSRALRSLVLTGLGGGKGHIISITATSSDAALVSNLSFHSGSLGTAGTLIFKTATNAVGSAVVTVTVTSDSADNNTFSRSFTVNVLPGSVTANLRPPSFSNKPMNIAAVAGKSVSLKAAAFGAGTVKYSWNFNGVKISGANGPVLTLSKITTAQAGLYSVTAANEFGATNSRVSVIVYDSADAMPNKFGHHWASAGFGH